jgi:hypothetical protein
MSNELERRLEGVLTEAPEPDPGAGEEALHRALRALRPVTASRRGLRTAVLVLTAALVLLVIAAGSLTAAGALHISIGTHAKPKPHLSLPKGANGIAAIVDGRLSVATKGGSLQGQPASAAALSPRALYVAAGIGNSLVAMAPDGRRAWTHPAGGKVVAIDWAPDGFRIAYIVQAGRHLVLHLIYGNGIHDTTIDRSVRAVRPSWRADSLAVAYVGEGGRAIVYDLAHKRHRLVGTAVGVTHVAFAPKATRLAVATPSSVRVGGKTVATGEVAGLGWLKGRPYAAHGFVVAVTPKLVIVRHGPKIFAGHTTLLTVPRNATVRDLQVG